MLILTANDVSKALPMDEAVQGMKNAFSALSDGRAEVPLRSQLSVPIHNARTLLMPAFVSTDEGESLGVKIVSIFPKNPPRGLPLIHAAVMILESGSGKPLALMEGGSLTAIRTGAASGAATDLLARGDCRVAAIFGAGVQGRTQLEAVCTVRQIHTVWVYDPNQTRIEEFIYEMAGRGSIPQDLRVAQSPGEAIQDADIICTATTSTTPVFQDQYLKAGVHINAVGSYTPEMQEISSETVKRALVVVDSRSASLAETGDLIQPIQSGIISEKHVHAEIGELILGRKPGRRDNRRITFFKSVGLAVQDVVASQLAMRNAHAMSLGQNVDL